MYHEFFLFLQYVGQDDESSDDEGMLCECQNLNFFPLNVVLNSILKNSCWLHFMYGQKSISCYMHSKNSRVLKFINQTMKFAFYIDFFFWSFPTS